MIVGEGGTGERSRQSNNFCSRIRDQAWNILHKTIQNQAPENILFNKSSFVFLFSVIIYIQLINNLWEVYLPNDVVFEELGDISVLMMADVIGGNKLDFAWVELMLCFECHETKRFNGTKHYIFGPSNCKFWKNRKCISR